MRAIVGRSVFLSVVGVAGLVVGVSHAEAAFTDPVFFGQANTTSQVWNGFTAQNVLNTPSTSTNAFGTATWTDTTGGTGIGSGDGAFPIGTAPNAHIYSFSGVVHPEVVLPSAGLGSDFTTTIVLQAWTEGGVLDTSAFTITPAGGSAITATADQITTTSSAATGSMGGTDTFYTVTWVLSGSPSSYTIDYAAAGTSVSQLAARVDSLTVPGTGAAVPEPASLGLLAVGAMGLVARRRK